MLELLEDRKSPVRGLMDLAVREPTVQHYPVDRGSLSAQHLVILTLTSGHSVAIQTPIKSWWREVLSQFVQLLSLEAGWDTYAGRRVDPQVLNEVGNFLEIALPTNAAPPTVVPLSDGGVQLEWHRKGWDLEVEFPAGDAPNYSAFQVSTPEAEEEGEVHGSRRLLELVRFVSS